MIISIIEHFCCVSLTFREFQSVKRRLERLSGEYRDGGASSSGIQSHSCLDRAEISILRSSLLFLLALDFVFSYFVCV
ncbi:hypothetical protein DEO72_LG10g1582 [Vigna unguiculata]|uniref:Uncharacterized protein n=1 Tax=Vigna unguiculata TaxID=3917 RepID=A0A4D6NBS6_VIGUN|nr:hypothetical protein DEO72_LG10g1582 [Vigna unguiculata]